MTFSKAINHINITVIALFVITVCFSFKVYSSNLGEDESYISLSYSSERQYTNDENNIITQMSNENLSLQESYKKANTLYQAGKREEGKQILLDLNKQGYLPAQLKLEELGYQAKKEQELKGESEREHQMNDVRFTRTYTMLSETMKMFQTLFNPPQPPQEVQQTNIEEIPSPFFHTIMGLISSFTGPSSLFSSASKLVEGTKSSLPNLKTPDYRTMIESMILAAMQARPQYFSLPEDEDLGESEIHYSIGHRFLKEFTQGPALEGWLPYLRTMVITKEPNNPHNTGIIEIIGSAAKLLKWMGSDAVNDPLADPLNKDIDPRYIKEAIELNTWLENNPKHKDYNVNHNRFMELDTYIKSRRDQAIRECGEYMYSLLKRIDPSLANVEKMTDVIEHKKEQWNLQKHKKFESYVLENYKKANTFEPNLLRSFWETLERNQFGEICYKIVCESFEKKDSLVHQIVQQIWCVSQLDTMNEHPKEARSRMPAASFDGNLAPNFGYAMLKSEAYDIWLRNPLVRASGDVIIDAYHSAVDFGRNLDIDEFLGIFQQHLNDGEIKRFEPFVYFFGHFLLNKVFNHPFEPREGRTFFGELERTAGSKENLILQSRYVLEDFKKFSNNMYALRPSSSAVEDNSRSNGLVFGIGFNGDLFNSPSHSSNNENEIWLAFANSGRSKGGYLLLSLIKRMANQGLKVNLSDDINTIFNKYRVLIKDQLNENIKNAYEAPNAQWDAHKRSCKEEEREKFQGFMTQLELETSYKYPTKEFQKWIRQTSNWYRVPSTIRIQIAPEMPTEEYHAQYVARSLLLDALVGRPFSSEHSELMPHLFLHWKKELLKNIDEGKRSTLELAGKLEDVPNQLKEEVLRILDNIVTQVHPELKSVWILVIEEQFELFMKPYIEAIENRLRQAKAKIKAITKSLKGLEKAKKDISATKKDKEGELSKVQKEEEEAKLELNRIPKSAAQLPLNWYVEFRDKFFENRDVSQCIEPVFSRVLGHDRFFAVFISKTPAKAPLIDKTDPDYPHPLRLGNKAPQDIIAPCDIRCQHHALGHLYTGDMLSYQSADRLDQKRRTHGLGEVPNQFMGYSDIGKYILSSLKLENLLADTQGTINTNKNEQIDGQSSISVSEQYAQDNLDGNNDPCDFTPDCIIKALFKCSGDPIIREFFAPEILTSISSDKAVNTPLENSEPEKNINREVYRNYIHKLRERWSESNELSLEDKDTKSIIATLNYFKKLMRHEYTDFDIAKLIHVALPKKDIITKFTMQGENNGDFTELVYKIGNRYILPPIGAGGGSDPFVQIAAVLSNFFTLTTVDSNLLSEIIIPFNSGGHWVTLRITINQDTIDIAFIDSLSHEEAEINKKKESHIRSKLEAIKRCLEEHFKRSAKVEILTQRIQPDSLACGAIAVENIIDLVGGKTLPSTSLSKEEILYLRINHLKYLKNSGFDLDFDVNSLQTEIVQ